MKKHKLFKEDASRKSATRTDDIRKLLYFPLLALDSENSDKHISSPSNKPIIYKNYTKMLYIFFSAFMDLNVISWYYRVYLN